MEDESEDLEHRSLENKFLKGVAISVWQNGGDKCDSNWTRFTHKKLWLSCLRRTVRDGSVDVFPGFWERYEEDILNARKLGSNCFRFSFEWAQIEPRRGEFDSAVIQKYRAFLDCLGRNEMVPVATLHHFTHPGWFEDLGGFEKEENISIFVDYCLRMFSEFGHRIHSWATFNEPTCYIFASFVAGVHAPGRRFSFFKAGIILRNLLKAHIAAYKAMKRLPHGPNAMIGLVHHHTKIIPNGSGLLHWFSRWGADWCNHWFGRDVVHEFMMTGKFYWKVPILGGVIEYKYNGKPPVDFWGLNYYGWISFGKVCQPTFAKPELLTDIGYHLQPEGLYQEIAKASQLEVPIYITETGIAESTDEQRPLMMKSYTNEVARAIKDGYDVRGFMYWTLVDNFEWGFGYTMRFGLYEWDPKGSGERIPRDSAKELKDIYEEWPENLDEMKEFARDVDIEDFNTLLHKCRVSRPALNTFWAWLWSFLD